MFIIYDTRIDTHFPPPPSEKEDCLQIPTEVFEMAQSPRPAQNENNGYNHDIGMWPEDMSSYIDYWIKTGNLTAQHCDSDLFEKKSFQQDDHKFVRKCHISLFERKTRNGELIKRSWLCFSLVMDISTVLYVSCFLMYAHNLHMEDFVTGRIPQIA